MEVSSEVDNSEEAWAGHLEAACLEKDSAVVCLDSLLQVVNHNLELVRLE